MRGAGAKMTGVRSLNRTIESISTRWTGNPAWTVGTNISYGIHVEFGTSRSKAQPYLRPAVEHVKRSIGRFARQASSLDDLVRRVALAIEEYAKQTVPVDTGTLRASITAEKLTASGAGASASTSITINA